MGKLVDGIWREDDASTAGGKFVRQETSFRDWITADGARGPGSKRSFKAEPGRYHLYVSYACPWAHRTLIFRSLKKLETVISVDIVHHHMARDGWTFVAEAGATGDSLHGVPFLRDVYIKADPHYTGRVTVPVLWDKQERTIVSNESADIIRMLNSAFDTWGDASVDFYPPPLRAEIDRLNAFIYPAVNNGVYRAGFATTQAAYEEAFADVFGALDVIERLLSERRYLTGARLKEADWRLFTTLLRFDPVYYSHFKCNLRRIADYPNLSNYLRDLYQTPGVAETVDMHHIKAHYFASHRNINPTGIIPVGPAMDLGAAHDRARLG